MRFVLIDQILEQTEHRIVTCKAVTAAEEYLADHFPSFPVLPGVMMLEAAVQAARKLMPENSGPWVLHRVKQWRYGNMVRPGEKLLVTVERKSDDAADPTFKAAATVNDSKAVSGQFELRPVN